MWQHLVVTFNGAGQQTGFYWNGQAQANLYPTHLGTLPFGPISVLSLGYDATRDGFERIAMPLFYDGTNGPWPTWENSPLQGDIADVQFYNYALSATQASGLYGGSTASCSPPAPPPPSPPPAPAAPPAPPSPPPGTLALPPNPPPPPSPPPRCVICLRKRRDYHRS